MLRLRGNSHTRSGSLARLTIVVLAIGLAILSAGLFMAGDEVFFMLGASSATAVYVDSVNRVGGNHGGTFLHPRFAFQPAPEQPLQVITSTGGSTEVTYSAGDTVRVYYDSANPEQARLATVWNMWIGPVLLAGAGLLVTSIATTDVVPGPTHCVTGRRGCLPTEHLTDPQLVSRVSGVPTGQR